MIYLLPTDTCFGIACALDDRKGYHRIYDIKKRSFSKPLALMVPSFEWLEEYTSLTSEQIDDLKKYPQAFTILTHCSYIEMFLKLEDEEEWGFENVDEYQMLAFRVAHTDIQKELLEEVGPIWLTSANFSWYPEIYDVSTLRDQFSKHLSEIEILAPDENYTLPPIEPSDIFSYTGESLEKEFLRKNS